MASIYADNSLTIGKTPLVQLNRVTEGCKARVLAKLEFFNPIGSVKDRIGVAMIEALEQAGRIGPNSVLIEPTSGNTGIALAFVAASKGYKLILVMPESMSIERRKMLALLGAELVLTPAEKGMKGAIAMAQELLERTPGAVCPSQFDNPANPEIHRKTTAEEIWNDTAGAVDIVISGVGTGGTITGVSRYIKRVRGKEIQSVAVEPTASPILTQRRHGEPLKPGPHKIQGIGANFVPPILDTTVYDEVLSAANADAFEYSRRVSAEEGILAGISSGAAIWAVREVAHREEFAGKNIVVIIPSFGERYVSSTLYRDLQEEYQAKQ